MSQHAAALAPEDDTIYCVTRADSWELASRYHGDNTDAGALVRYSFAAVLVLTVAVFTSASFLFPWMSHLPVSQGLYLSGQIVFDIRTIIVYLLLLWYLLMQLLSGMVNRMVEQYEPCPREFCWTSLSRSVSEWMPVLVLMPDGQIHGGPPPPSNMLGAWLSDSSNETSDPTTPSAGKPDGALLVRRRRSITSASQVNAYEADEALEQLRARVRAHAGSAQVASSSVDQLTVAIDDDEDAPLRVKPGRRSRALSASSSGSNLVLLPGDLQSDNDAAAQAGVDSNPDDDGIHVLDASTQPRTNKRDRIKSWASGKSLSSITSAASLKLLPRFLRGSKGHHHHHHAASSDQVHLQDDDDDASSPEHLRDVVVHRMKRSVSAHTGLTLGRRRFRGGTRSSQQFPDPRLGRSRTISTNITPEEWQQTYGGTYMIAIMDWSGRG
ncbi:hypothetical protein RI367_003770 [Sorochytrium milnesiophthora]